VEVPPDAGQEGSEVLTGVFDVKSASTQVGMNGVAYNEW
jgi:hypothetical protein